MDEIDTVIREVLLESRARELAAELSEDGRHAHSTRPPWSEGMTWVYCPTCEEYVHEPCGLRSCKCDDGGRR